MSDSLTWKCSCGAIYREEHNLLAHVKAMEERNATLPVTGTKDDLNRREVHVRVTNG